MQLRERFSFDDEQIKKLLQSIRVVMDLDDLFILSTCNRTEIYYSSKVNYRLELLKIIQFETGMLSKTFTNYFTCIEGKAAVKHLYHVALGIDSMVLGDMQIINQVKKAYQIAADQNTMGPFGHRLLHAIFHTNKRVNIETQFRGGNTSLASASVARAREFAQQFKSPKIVLVGLGEIGITVAENLKKFKGEIVVLNRTLEKAKEVASRFEYKYNKFENLTEEINSAQVVISSVRTISPIITSEQIYSEDIRHQLMVDLSVPRSISDEITEVRGVQLLNVDELTQQTDKTKQLRESKIQEVNVIIESSIAEMEEWQSQLEYAPHIRQLKAALETIRQEEVSRQLDKITTAETAVLETTTKNIIQKIIKLPVLQLKNGCKRDETENLAQSLIDLFDLSIDSIESNGSIRK